MPTGVISKINSREWNDVVLWSLQLVGDKTWYRSGETNPATRGAVEGANVSFDLTPKGNVSLPSLKVVSAGTAPTRAPTPQASSGSKDQYWNDKEARDIAKEKRYQNVDVPRMTFCGAQDTAVRVVEMALAQGALKLGTKDSAKLDILLESIQKVALDLFYKRINAPTMEEVLTGGDEAGAETDNNNEVANEDE